MTHPDVIKGKLRYLAPEVTMGKPASVQSDLFSLGIVMWEALAERPLYPGNTDAEVFLAARKAEIPPLRELRSDLPVELIEIIERALAKELDRRYQTAKEMLRALTKVLRRITESTDAYTLSQTAIVARRFLGLPEARTAPPPTD
jgi:serine/threonine-protein kinase